jgi:hypothetical protein
MNRRAVFFAAALVALSHQAHAADPDPCSGNLITMSRETCVSLRSSNPALFLDMARKEYEFAKAKFEQRQQADRDQRQQEILETLKRIELNSRQRGQ